MRRFLTLVTLFLSTSWLSAQMPPQTEKDKWEISFFAGLATLSDQTGLAFSDSEEVPRLVSAGFDSGYLAGIRITENLSDRFSAELEYSFSNQPLDFRDLSTAVPALDLDHGVHSFSYEFLVHLLPRNSGLRPYLAAGAGASLFWVTGSSKDRAEVAGISLNDSWKFAGRLGGGVKCRLNEKLGIRFDVRDQISGVPDYSLPASAPAGGPAFDPDGVVHHWQFSTGLLIYWEGF